MIGESDPEGCAACSCARNPENAYRNGTMYSSYTAAQIARTFELADQHEVNLLGSVTWAFEFEDQPYFEGFRDLATNGIDKPVLNVFRMLGMMHGDRVAVTSTGALHVETIRDAGVRGAARCLRACDADADHAMEVLVWNYHDDDLAAPPAADVTIDGLPAGTRRSRSTAWTIATAMPTRHGRRWGRRNRRQPRNAARSRRRGSCSQSGRPLGSSRQGPSNDRRVAPAAGRGLFTIAY